MEVIRWLMRVAHKECLKSVPVLPGEDGRIFVFSVIFRESSIFPTRFYIKDIFPVDENAQNFNFTAVFYFTSVDNQLKYDWLLKQEEEIEISGISCGSYPIGIRLFYLLSASFSCPNDGASSTPWVSSIVILNDGQKLSDFSQTFIMSVTYPHWQLNKLCLLYGRYFLTTR